MGRWVHERGELYAYVAQAACQLLCLLYRCESRVYLTIVFTFIHLFRRILVEERTKRVEVTRVVVCGEFCMSRALCANCFVECISLFHFCI